jgi:PHD/YefM family antitoxin component YafN of YafNO toxin-antitoxin module
MARSAVNLPRAVAAGVARPKWPTDDPHPRPRVSSRRAAPQQGSLAFMASGPCLRFTDHGSYFGGIAAVALHSLAICPETPYFPGRRIAMPQTVSSVEASKSFGRISRQALMAPLTITHHGHDSLVLMSAAEYQRLKRRDREVLTMADFTDEDRAAVAASRAPAEASAFDGEVQDN